MKMADLAVNHSSLTLQDNLKIQLERHQNKGHKR